MFSLRDEIFPREAGHATALSVPAYQQQVGRVCDEVNHDDRRRAAETKATRRRLERAKTTIDQRNALLDGVRQTTARSGHALASFAALETPKDIAAAHRDAEAAWNRNLARLRDYALSLDRAGTRPQLLAAINHLSTLRPLLARDGVRLTSGLDHLGGASCDLRAAPRHALVHAPSAQHPKIGGPRFDPDSGDAEPDWRHEPRGDAQRGAREHPASLRAAPAHAEREHARTRRGRHLGGFWGRRLAGAIYEPGERMSPGSKGARGL